MARPPIRRRSHLVRTIAIIVGGVIALAVAGIVVFVATFDPNSRKPQIIAAVQAATGRELTIGGRIGLSLSLQPTLEVTDVVLSNPPGFSRPQMATLQKLKLQLALLPLLSKRVQIEQLVLVQPDILLETNAQGQSNWDLAPAGAAGPRPASVPLSASSPAPPPSSAAAPSPAPPAPPASSASSAPPTGNAAAPPTGNVAAPGAGNAAAPPPGIALSSVTIENGTLAMRDATGQTMTLLLKQLTATEAAPKAPLHLTLNASYNGAPVSLIADTGPLGGLLGVGRSPWPIKLEATVAGAKVNVDGTMAQPAAGHGLAMTVDMGIPDLSALSPLAGTKLPALKTIAGQLKLADTDGGNGIAISDLKLTLPSADLAGSLSVQRGARPLITANLSAKQFNLDTLTRALPAGAPGQPAAPAASAAPSGRVIPDTRLPFDALRLVDADLQLALDDLREGGQDYRSVKLHAVVKDGQLTLDPLTFDAPGDPPGGQVDVKATVDATQAAPPVTLTLHAPALILQSLLKALGKPGYASGTLDLRADLRGAGDTPHAIAASLNGAIGAAVAKGQIDSQLLGSLMASLVQKTELAQLASKAGMSALNCFALRVDANGGIGTVRALRLDSSTLGMTGDGTLNFATETLDLHLRPTAGLAGTTITAPMIVKGSFAAPSVQPDVVGTVTGNAGTAAKLALGASTGGLALIIGSAVDQKVSGDVCAEPLALARFAQVPAASGQSNSSPPAAAQPAAKPANNPLNTLKKLFQ